MSREREVGLRAVQDAANLCQAVRAEMVEGASPAELAKGDRSPVTVADFGAQALVCRILGEAFPADAVVAEESSAQLREDASAQQLAAVIRYVAAQVPDANAGSVCEWIDRGQGQPGQRFWVLDPIDGTKGFLRQDQYAVALALVEDGAVTHGFLACPALQLGERCGAIFVAQRGQGVEVVGLDGTAIGRATVSAIAVPRAARLAESVEAAHTNQGLAAQLRSALAIQGEPVRMDSQAKYGAVAWGAADIYLRAPNARTPDYREQLWDHAAGALVVEEAGGAVSDVYGRPLQWTAGRRLEANIGVLATNGVLHEAVVAALAPLLAAS